MSAAMPARMPSSTDGGGSTGSADSASSERVSRCSCTSRSQAAQDARCCREGLLLGGLQRREGVADGQLLEGDVVRGRSRRALGSVVQPPGSSPPAAFDSPSRDSFMRRIPASMRVFTVPSGVAVSPAISRCV